jgi:O-antigen ligase
MCDPARDQPASYEPPARLTAYERQALALLALAPAAFLPFALNRFVFPKLTVLAAGVLLASFVPARGRLPRSALALLLAGAAVLAAAALDGADPAVQIIGRAPRFEGGLVLPVYLGAGVAGARLLGPGRARGSSAWFLRWLALAALAIAIEAALEATGLHPLASSSARPGSLLGNASDEGAWALLALGPLTAVALRIGGRMYVAGALAAAVVLVCSGSRGALLGAVATVLVLLALTPYRAQRVALCLGAAVLAVAALALPATRERVLGTSPLAAHTTGGRELLWGETLDLIDAHPLLGVGPSGYLDAIPAYHDRRYEREVGPADPPDAPHDWILQAAVDGGLPLVALALALAFLTVARGVATTRRAPTGGEAAVTGGMLAGLAGYGVALLFHLTSPGTCSLAAVLGGALLAERRNARYSDRSGASGWALEHVAGTARRLRRPVLHLSRLALAALTLVFAAAAAAEIPLRSAIDAAASGDIAAANGDFRAALALRPWDPGIDATAAHAYATLVNDGVTVAAPAGAPWAAKELGWFPHSTQALTDSATIELADGRVGAAARLLRRALRGDPMNPQLRAEAVRIEAEIARHVDE